MAPPSPFLRRSPGYIRVFVIAPKAHFQLAAELSRSRDFACPLTMFVRLVQGLMLHYLRTHAVGLPKIEAT